MNILPTIEGGVSIQPQSEDDWLELESICADASLPTHLAESLSDLMQNDSGWEEFVLPDLVENFTTQCRHVAAAIKHARDHDEHAIFITPSQVENWYGALNQARLSLETRYKLETIHDTDDVPPEVSSAYFRNRFYLFLQSMLLEYAMEDQA